MVKCMFSRLKQWAFGAFVSIAFALSIGALGQCSKPVHQSSAKIDTIILEHRDTIVKLDTILKTRIKYIDTSRIDTVHDILDRIIPIDTADNDGNQVIAANQLREAVKWKDSLNTCLDMRKVDSVALDTMSKLAKKVDTIKACTITEQAKSFGLGALIGIGLGSLF